MRIAIASRTGKFVDQHFGKCTTFYVFDVNERNYYLSEVRENTPACGTEDEVENRLLKSSELISDCQAVVVSRIGYEANEILSRQGIDAYVITDLVEDVLRKFIKYINLTVRSGNGGRQKNKADSNLR